MAYPDLYSDETIVLNAQNIKVKSVSFEAILTTRRLILVDSKKHLIAPQEILLATLRDIEVGENAIRDPTITLSIITNTGATRQMILTFSKTSGGERRRESEEWVKALRQQISTSVQHPIMPDNQSPGEFHSGPADVPYSVQKEEPASIPATPSPKKKIEIARPGPIKKIAETAPPMPKPVETSTLPTGSFCNRCGSRVPPESAFCNKCGTPVVTEADMEARITGVSPTQATPIPSIPQVHVQTPPEYGTGTDKKERPIEEVIHSIEPLIEDSVPRKEPAPIVPKQHGQPVTETPAPPETGEPAIPEVKWPVISSNSDQVVGQPAPGESPSLPPPVPVRNSGNRRSLGIGILAIAIIAIVAAIVIFANPLGGIGTSPSVPVEVTTTPTAAATETMTTQATTVPKTATVSETTTPSVTTQQAVVPAQGVFVRVIYADQYKGTVGTPNDMLEVADNTERLFQIPTTDGIVVASIQKKDGTSNKLIVEVYKNGKLVAERSTVTPKGIVEIQVDLKPAATPTPTPTATKVPVPVKTTASVNTTATVTGTSTSF